MKIFDKNILASNFKGSAVVWHNLSAKKDVK